MTAYIRIISIFLLLLITTVPQILKAEINNIASAINKAGSQRMLSQRIVATYSQTAMGIQGKKSSKQLKQSIELFEAQMEELRKYRPSGDINKQLVLVKELWIPMKEILARPPHRPGAKALRKQAEEVLKASHRVVLMLEKESGLKAGRLVNLSGRQRMLSQRISNLYMLQSWGFNDDVYIQDYATSINEFRQALTELMSNKNNTKVINKKLNKARKQFGMLEKSARLKNGEYIPLMVKMSADKLLVIMNDITQEYDELARQALVSSR